MLHNVKITTLVFVATLALPAFAQWHPEYMPYQPFTEGRTSAPSISSPSRPANVLPEYLLKEDEYITETIEQVKPKEPSPTKNKKAQPQKDENTKKKQPKEEEEKADTESESDSKTEPEESQEEVIESKADEEEQE